MVSICYEEKEISLDKVKSLEVGIVDLITKRLPSGTKKEKVVEKLIEFNRFDIMDLGD
jgi:hypothetical protein